MHPTHRQTPTPAAQTSFRPNKRRKTASKNELWKQKTNTLENHTGPSPKCVSTLVWHKNKSKNINQMSFFHKSWRKEMIKEKKGKSWPLFYCTFDSNAKKEREKTIKAAEYTQWLGCITIIQDKKKNEEIKKFKKAKNTTSGFSGDNPTPRRQKTWQFLVLIMSLGSHKGKKRKQESKRPVNVHEKRKPRKS